MIVPALALSCLAAGAPSSRRLPPQITTLDGKTYNGVVEQAEAVYPDGIVIRYQPAEGGQAVPGGIAQAKLKFRDLPEELQHMFGYEAKSATEFEVREAKATGEWLQAQAAEEGAIRRYMDLAEMHRALAGDADASYAVAMDSSGKVSACLASVMSPSPTRSSTGRNTSRRRLRPRARWS